METPAKYYTSIIDLPLSVFRQVQIKKNFYALIIEGKPTEKELLDAWDDIRDEYNDRMQDGTSKLHFNLLKEVALLKIKLQKIDMCIEVLETELAIPYVPPQQKFKDKLNEMVESKFKFDRTKPEEFRAELKRARNRSKSILINYEIKNRNLEAINGKNCEIKPPSDEYYDSLLNELSLFAKYEIQDNITVSRFCDMVLKYNRHVKHLEEQAKKK